MQSKIVIFGLGYCAKALISFLFEKNWSIYVVSRKPQPNFQIESDKIKFLSWKREEEIKRALEESDVVLSSVPPNQICDPILDIFDTHLCHIPKTSKIIYLSSTGVYGDHNGKWVHEHSTLRPSTELGIRRLAAEKAWLSFSKKLSVSIVILRLAGIYGPDRSPVEKLINKDVTVIRAPGILFSRIHIDDISKIIFTIMNKQNIFGIINVCDNKPDSPENVIKEAARLLNFSIPASKSLGSANLSKNAQEFFSESKKVSNKKLVNELGYQLIYPTYVEGLKSIISQYKDRPMGKLNKSYLSSNHDKIK